MSAVPVVMQVIIYPRDKSVEPYPATIAGYAARSDVGVGGGPIIPPGEEVPPIDPPGEVWPPEDLHPDHTLPGDLPHVEHPIVLPPECPEVPPDPPVTSNPIKPNAWNWNDGSNPTYPNVGWFYVHVPGPGEPQPKKRRK